MSLVAAQFSLLQMIEYYHDEKATISIRAAELVKSILVPNLELLAHHHRSTDRPRITPFCFLFESGNEKEMLLNSLKATF